jgi:drug/metabolite transporter (DMT)-like permease
MTRLRADLLLLICAAIWGSAFVAQKDVHALRWPLLFVGARFALSALMLAPLALREARTAAALEHRDRYLAAGIGACLATAAGMQQLALTGTSATHGGFLTAVYVAFVPFVVWALTRTKPRPAVLAACAASVAGAWLLADRSPAGGWNTGDLLLLASDWVWALHITLVGKFLGRCQRPFLLCFAQYAVTAAAAGAMGLATERVAPGELRAALPSVLYAGLASGGIAYTLQIVAQRYTPAAEAALIMSLESVFAAVAGALLLHERLAPIAWLGCALILSGAIMVELAPELLRRLARPLPRSEE